MMSSKFKQIYLNGCSFMWGMGHSNPNTFQFFEETKDIDTSHGVHWNGHTQFNNYDWVREKYNIAGRLKEHYADKEIIDQSIYGGSLQRVIRKTYNWIINNYEAAAETLFILEWPVGVRNEIYIPIQNRYVNYTSNFDNFDGMDPYIHRLMINEFAPNFFSEGIHFIEDLHSIIGLLSFIKQTGGQYLILLDEFPIEKNSDETLKYINENRIKNILNEFVYPHIIRFNHTEKQNIKSMIEYYRDYEKATITNDTQGMLQDDHNSLRGTKLITEQIIQNINELS
jgi:hypothetical protein